MSAIVKDFQRKPKLLLFVVHVNIFLYAMSFWTQNGTYSHLARTYKLNQVTHRMIQTILSVLNALAEPIFGWFCDVFGSRDVLYFAYLAALLAHILLSLSQSVAVMTCSRIPTLFIHAMLGAQSIITDMTEPKQRTDYLGKLHFSYGIGSFFGIIVSNVCDRNSYHRLPAYVAAAGSLLSLFLVFCFVPHHTKFQTSSSDQLKKLNAWKSFILLPWKNASTQSMLTMNLVAAIPIAALDSMFVVIVYEQFGNDLRTTESMLNYMEILSMITQGFIVGRLFSFGFKEWFLLKTPIAMLTFAFATLGLFVLDWRSFCLIILLMTLAWSVFSLVLLCKLTTTVPQSDTGAVLGYNMGLYSIIRVLTPLIGSVLLRGSIVGLGVRGFFCNGLLCLHLATRSNGRVLRV